MASLKHRPAAARALRRLFPASAVGVAVSGTLSMGGDDMGTRGRPTRVRSVLPLRSVDSIHSDPESATGERSVEKCIFV